MTPPTQNWMRDYDPTTGRYMQADPLGLVDGASVYGYAGQSPQVNADPTGLCWNIHSNACKAVNKARFNATLASMNAYTAANAGYAVGMAASDGCITADEAMGVVSAAAFGAAGHGIGKLLGLAFKSPAIKAFLRDEVGALRVGLLNPKSSAQAAALATHFSDIASYGKAGFRQLANGRYRYYDDIQLARTPGTMVGSRGVMERDAITNQSRYWRETIDGFGRIRIVRPQLHPTDKTHYQFDELGSYIGKF